MNGSLHSRYGTLSELISPASVNIVLTVFQISLAARAQSVVLHLPGRGLKIYCGKLSVIENILANYFKQVQILISTGKIHISSAIRHLRKPAFSYVVIYPKYISVIFCR